MMNPNRLIFMVAIFLTTFTNMLFFKEMMHVYPFCLNNIAFIGAIFVIESCLSAIILSILCYKLTIKPVLIIILIASSNAAYFMDNYHIVIDQIMIDNILQSSVAETLDLLSFKLFIYLFFLGFLPAFVIFKMTLIKQNFLPAVLNKMKYLSFYFILMLSIVWALSNQIIPFFREHRDLRYYINPAFYITSSVKYLTKPYRFKSEMPFQKIALDAKKSINAQRKLVIFVVGETARADHFSLNGYAKQTNPLLEKTNIFNFSNVYACGTSTLHSVPCMFSIYTHHNFDKQKVAHTENVLDILNRVGVNVLWLDNNSSSKGVATRLPHIDYMLPENNPLCDIECRDEGMLLNLQDYIAQQTRGDIFIVLHQMGNHGPSYYKRYPESFKKFTPICETNQFEQCSQAAINNTYDNAILYTDYFLAKTIHFLEKNSEKFQTAMLYVSDHGESLGENGIYLHGLPYFIAPETQKHVPLILWFGKSFNIKPLKLGRPLSHDNIFHTILGLMAVKTVVYVKKLDITKN